ncbi:Alpha/Beta hydrolase protein [Lobosporangium transversale]|uniref:Alpha/Beta hydrolase protein n=1 Tax=Lobosporangium transversale TaxID=64571 RepID=A0A1Y2GVL6_9FUNG|nr:Alpha/Beta hydrolase protein [Lobosporangium transversale]ORZ23752.1 Alpha/Beta hydrolase protein [Lobosporangium transversale]|eukprot:XP_021883566.1 Alpha/Beta hydrolase protein [Lobosporangium transversale]
MKKKAALVWNFLLPKAPLLIKTTVSHFTFGPAKPSWSYKFSITMAMARAFAAHLEDVPLKQSQIMSRLNDKYAPIHAGANSSESTIPNTYRDKAAVYVSKLLRDQDIDSDKLGWDWEHDPRIEKPLKGEWTETKVKDEKFAEGRTVLYLHGGGYFLCSIRTHRWATWNMARLGGAKVFSLDYRLAPDSPFPAALHDALAAYLYLLDPPADSNITPVDPKNLVIMGDSAGGGLTFATMLAIRDAGLPLPAGIIGWSPWIDLLHSMPSLLENTASDYLPAEGFSHGGQASLKKLAKAIVQVTPGLDDDMIMQKLPTVQHYTNNRLLRCKYVSPVLEDDLAGTCPIMIIAGDGEMLRDESIVFAKKHANAPTSILLRVYDDMPHVFQMFGFLPSAKHSLYESGDFIRSVTLGGNGLSSVKNDDNKEPIKSYERISIQGWRRPLEDDIPDWKERIGKLGGGPKFLAKL